MAPKDPPVARLLSTADVARRIGTMSHVIRLARRSGALRPAATTEGGIFLFAEDEVERFIARRAARKQALKQAAAEE